jgi:hypothetical protein
MLPQSERQLKRRSGRTRRRGHRVIQGHSQDRRHGKCQRSGHAGLDMDCGASVQPGGLRGGGGELALCVSCGDYD